MSKPYRPGAQLGLLLKAVKKYRQRTKNTKFHHIMVKQLPNLGHGKIIVKHSKLWHNSV